MSNVTDPSPSAESLVADRRRPGRLESVNPELIPLLRGQGSAIPAEDLEFEDVDQLGTARGILAGVALSTPLWLVFLVIGRWLFS